MHALTLTDQMVLLEDFAATLADLDLEDGALVAEARSWVDRLDETEPWTHTLRQQVRELQDLLESAEKQDALLAARAGLAYLERSGGPAPEALGGLALQAHAFVLSLLIQRARQHQGRGEAYQPKPLPNEDRLRAEAIFERMHESPFAPDRELIERTVSFCENPGLPLGSAFVTRLLRNARFLANVLETDEDPEHRATARAGLGYLLLEEDSISDSLGLFGFLDDAWILDRAVSTIEPARQPWIRLLECAADAWPLLMETEILHHGDAGVAIDRNLLTEGALLAEPLAPGAGPLDEALFIPTTGTVPLLLALCAVIDLLRDAVEGASRLRHEADSPRPGALADLAMAGVENPPPQRILLAAPLDRMQSLVQRIQIDGTPLDELVAIGQVSPDGEVQTWCDADLGTPLLWVVGSLDEARQVLERSAYPLRMVLVDLAVATGESAQEEDEPVTEELETLGDPGLEESEEDEVESSDPLLVDQRRRDRTTTSAAVDLLDRYMDEATAIERLQLEDENQLSLRMIAARERLTQAAPLLGPQAFAGLTWPDNVSAEARDRVLHAFAQLATGPERQRESARAEATRLLAALPLEDEFYGEMLQHRVPLLREARAARRSPEEASAFEENHGVAPAFFLEAYTTLADAVKLLDECVARLTRTNLRLVLWMAKKYRTRSFYLDMIQEGNLGLMRAARKFDHRKGARFGSYAGWWIRQAIEGYLSRHSRTIRIPVNTLSLIRRVTRVQAELGDKLHRLPTNEEVARSLAIPEEEVERALRIGHDLERGCVALDGPIDEEGGSTLADVLPDQDASLAVDDLGNAQLARHARELLDTLEPLERQVIELRFGIGDVDRLTLQAIGQQVHLTKERIRQIELKALAKLRFRAMRAGVRP